VTVGVAFTAARAGQLELGVVEGDEVKLDLAVLAEHIA
jgi:hypothetical protein